MKHKLTVLACVGLALLLSTGFAFAQNTITVVGGNAARCATILVDVQLNNADGVGAIGLPLSVTGGTLVSVSAGAGLAGWTTAINQSGNDVIVNGLGPCLNAGTRSILTLEIETSSDCSGDVIVDLDGTPAVPASLLLAGCDCCELPATFEPGTLTLVNQSPVCGVNSNENLDWQSEIVDKALNASDPDACDVLTFNQISGPGSTTQEGLFSWDPDCADVGNYTVTFEVSDDCGATVECSFDITVTQQGPVCDAVAPQSVHWLDHLHVNLGATDDGCGTLTWTLDSDGGLGGTLVLNSSNGDLDYDPACSDVPGTYLVEYTVDDGEFNCQGSVEITVTNDAPTVVCPDPVDGGFLCDGQIINGGDGIFNLGELVEGQAIGNDANGDPLTYSIISAPATVNAPTIDGSGNFSWQSDGNDAEGTYEFCIEVSDGCAADTCCFSIEMELNIYVSIKDASGTVDTIPAAPGEIACVYVNIFPGIDLGGFDLLLCYDQSTLSFLGGITPLNDLAEWEYFTYRYGANSNCSGSCPSGLIRVVAIADMDNGPSVHPSDDAFGLEGNVIEICFQTTSDINFYDQCLPIGFCSYDCGDNTLSSKSGNILYVAHGALADCPDPKPGYDAREEIDFCGGAICLREPIDPRGDLNLNFIANEVGDAVLYSSYFIHGIDVFSSNPDNRLVQIEASDVNNDGVTLTVADLIYLIRIITGDAQPFPGGNPKVAPYANSASVLTDARSGRMVVTTNADVELGGAVLVFRYSDVAVGKAETTDATEGLQVTSKANRGEYRVLIAPDTDAPSAIKSGRNEIVSIPYEGNGTIELVEIQLSDAQGQLMSTDQLAKVQPPQSYSLLQNYPNPFNAGTVIRFDLRDASDWNLTVYNITGQVVRNFSGHNEASQVSVEWNGRDNNGSEVASGVYLYKVTAGEFESSKKMTLIK